MILHKKGKTKAFFCRNGGKFRRKPKREGKKSPDEVGLCRLAVVDQNVLRRHRTVDRRHKVRPLGDLLRARPLGKERLLHDPVPEDGIAHDAVVERRRHAAGGKAVRRRPVFGDAERHVLHIGDDAALARRVFGELRTRLRAR